MLRTGLGALLCAFTAVSAPAAGKDQTRADVRKSANSTLDRLYKLEPSARWKVGNAAGYAVFIDIEMKVLFSGGGWESRVAVSNKNHNEIFMKMVEVQAGLGVGIKKFRLVWVFDTQQAFDSFVNSGWEFGAQSTAAAKTGNTGAAAAGTISVSPGVRLYQLTDDGLALELRPRAPSITATTRSTRPVPRLMAARPYRKTSQSSATTRGKTPASPGAAKASASSPIPAAHRS
jgi:lipid-binding SYLF domain-containing protein